MIIRLLLCLYVNITKLRNSKDAVSIINHKHTNHVQGDEAAEKAGVEEVALVSHPATLGGCGGVDGVCKRVSKEWNRFVSITLIPSINYT